MFKITNLEPESALGFSRIIFIIAAYSPVIEGISVLLLIEWVYVSGYWFLFGLGVYIIIRYFLLGWLFELMQNGSRTAVIIQTICAPIVILFILEGLLNADSSANRLLGLVYHTYIFQTLNLVLLPFVLYANWSTIIKIRKGTIRIIKQKK